MELNATCDRHISCLSPVEKSPEEYTLSTTDRREFSGRSLLPKVFTDFWSMLLEFLYDKGCCFFRYCLRKVGLEKRFISKIHWEYTHPVKHKKRTSALWWFEYSSVASVWKSLFDGLWFVSITILRKTKTIQQDNTVPDNILSYLDFTIIRIQCCELKLKKSRIAFQFYFDFFNGY